MKWQKIILNGHDTKHIISDRGNVINLKTGHELKKHLSDGYLRVCLHLRKDTHINVARVMLKAFYDDNGNGKILYFEDGDVTNLNISNIKYITVNELYHISVDKLFVSVGSNTFKLQENQKYDDELWSIIYIDKNITKYMISNHGRVMNIITGGLLNPCSSNHGYPYLTIRANNKSYRMDIHKYVALYFVSNPNPKICTVVHHRDSNKQNFYYKNLQWVTPSDNTKYAVLNGDSPSGENSPNSKISTETAEKICKMLSDGFRICEICTELNVSRSIVRHIKDGHTWKHVSNKYDTTNYTKMRVSKSDIDVILDLFSKGKEYKEISDITGISISTLYKIKKDNNILNSKMNKSYKKRIDAMIIKLYRNDDMSESEISDLTGMTKKYISDIITHFES